MPEMHLRQPKFKYSAIGPFTKKKTKIEKFKEIGYLRYTYQNELDKSCFQHDSVKVLRVKAFAIASNP